MASSRTAVLRVLRAVGIAALPVANLFLFATFSIYAGNTAEFAGAYPDLFVLLLPYAFAVILMLAVPGILLTGKARARYEALLCALAVLLWIQGSFLVWHYGVFDGSSINWLEGAWRGIVDIALWVAVLLFAIYRFEKVGRGLLLAALAGVAIQLVAVAVSLGGQPQILQARDVESNIDGRVAAMRFSKTNNIVHIVMDGFQSDIFADIVSDTTMRDFQQELRGFTYFENHLGAYPYTQLTLPAMLSGKLFHNDRPYAEFVAETIQGHTITNTAATAGYEIDVMAPTPLKNVYANGALDNAFGIAANDHVTADDIATIDAARLIDLALFRVLPHFGKALVHRDELWVFQSMVQSTTYLHLQYFADIAFLNDLAAEMTVDRDAPVYKLMHVMLSHRPIVGNERCEFDGRKHESRATVTTHAQCGLVAVLNVLQRMKDLGIYDSSVIVLMADHGAWVPVEDFAEASDIGALGVGMATPLLAVKPANATAPFSVSASPTAITDVPATIADLAGLDAEFPGQSAFAVNPDQPRERHHLTYAFGINPDAEGYLYPMQEWVVTGNPYDSTAWQKGARYAPAP